jgi:hypothetical protein
MLTSSIVLIHNNAHPHTTARTGTLQLGAVWPPLLTALALASSNYHLFTYLKNWLLSQRFNNNGSWWKVSKCSWAHRQQTWHRHTKTYSLIRQSASTLTVTMLRSSLRMYVFFCTYFFLIAWFVNSSPEATFWIALTELHNFTLLC